MTKNRLPAALSLLQWVLGLVIMEASLRFAFSHAAARDFARTGLPDFIRLALALAEIVAVLLFLIPHATQVGGRTLIAVLAFALLWFAVPETLSDTVANPTSASETQSKTEREVPAR